MRSLAIRGLVVGTFVGFVGVVALGFAIAAAGAGHGTYIPAKLLFPFTMLSGVFGDSLTLPYLVVALVQFPLYGFILGRVLPSPHYRAYLVCLLCVHFAMVGVVLASNDSFAAAPRERPNQAMQLTASKPAVYASAFCRRERILRSIHRGLAAADLVSR